MDQHYSDHRKIDPTKGETLPDGSPNEGTMHAGMPVVKGAKYVITKWYRTRQWR